MIATMTAMLPGSGVNVWSVGFAIQVVLFCTISSLGAAGVGGGNLQASLMALSMLGLDVNLLIILYAMDFFLGILRPTLNQNGSLVAGAIAQKIEDRKAKRSARTVAKAGGASV